MAADDALATVLYAVFSPASGRLTFSSAGHPPPLLVEADGTTRFLRGGLSPALGAPWSGIPPLATIHLDQGDTVALYTDGLVDSPGQELSRGLTRLAQTAALARGETLGDLCARLIALGMHGGGPADDLTAVALRPHHPSIP
jgi:serine phosphatase RsbU (regulator of sigma subunit)